MRIHHHLALNVRPTEPDDQIKGAGGWSIYQDEWVTLDDAEGPVIETSSTPYLDGFATADAATTAVPH